ncbi:MAG: hypothetical protein M5U18_17530 [Dehalococcoidia bacterium]|nr:hypothetical protein [Dehalococcoidia bacterium]
MLPTDMSEWPHDKLRSAFFDFSLRGEGDLEVVAAVLKEWHARGGLSDESLHRWQDAIEWREMGNRLTSWDEPEKGSGPVRFADIPDDPEWDRFQKWRIEHKGRGGWDL